VNLYEEAADLSAFSCGRKKKKRKKRGNLFLEAQ